jgi:hypothetical protein
MLPKSLVKLGETARGVTKEADSWPPPLLGSVSVASEVASNTEEFGSDSELSEEEEEDDDDQADDGVSTPPTTPPTSETVKLSPSASRDVYALLSQLRSLTSRLTVLESIVTKGVSPSSSSPNGVPMNRPWYSFSSSKPTADGPAAGADLMTLSASKLSLFMTIGSAAGAAVALAAVSAWGRRRM